MILKQALEQFEIFTVYIYLLEMLNIYIYLSNLHLYILFIFIISFIIYNKTYNNLLFRYNILYLFIEVCYKFLLDILTNQAGKGALPFFSYIYTLFFFICISNIMGIMPFSYTITSHIIITFSLGFTVLVAITLLGFSYQKLQFLDLFIPKNIPFWLLPLLVSIELISFLSRGLSLSIRLFANILSGHVLLHILTGFIFSLYKFSKIAAIITFMIVLSVSSLELFLAILQAYVFTVLTCIYLSDSLNSPNH